jgi:cellulose synthase (UDP-forming)
MGLAVALKILAEPLPLWGRLLRAASLLLAALCSVVFITVPMEVTQQAILTILGIVAFVIINRFESRRASLVLAVMSILITSRYLFWRVSETMVFDTFFEGFLCVGLILAETYAGVFLVLAYVQTVFPLNRRPVPLPVDPADWPTIDVFIPTYNESLDLVRYTVLAALHLDWPRDKLNVWILDDGRREQYRAFADACGCGYIIRPDNKGAKAGNLNHALRHTKGEYIAIFDCDHAPTRAFLQMTVGWLLRDSRIALVQTPHHFYSPDPFERNLAYKIPVPNEGLLFYGVIQPCNDLWNAAFFCGSCAVIRRTALEEIGGVPTETVTEDCHCSLRMQQRGWHTAFLRLPLAAGLATERLALHIGQRLRWGRGMIQILRLEKTPFARGLRPIQRLCYFASSFSFLFSIPRLVFLTAPLAFLYFGENLIAASPLAIFAYAGSHIFHTFATTGRMNGPNRHSFWSEIYEAVMAIPLLPVALLALWDPTKGKFNVTAKGGTLERGYLDLRDVAPNIVLLLLLLIGFALGLRGIFSSEGLAFQAYLLNTIWCGMCLIPVSGSIAVGAERQQSREWARTRARIPAELVLADGTRIAAHSTDVSLSGARMHIEQPLGSGAGDSVVAAFTVCDEVVDVPCTLLRWESDTAFLQFHSANLRELAAITQVFFSRPDAWLHWDDWRRDRPLRSLGEVVLAALSAVFRRHRVTIKRQPASGAVPEPEPGRVSSVVPPRHQPAVASVMRRTAILVVLLLASAGFADGASLRRPAIPPAGTTVAASGNKSAPQLPPPAAPAPAINTVPPIPGAAAPGGDRAPPATNPTPLPAAGTATALPTTGVRQVKRTLRELGLTGPIQLRGTSDLQGVLFGVRADEVVSAAKLTLFGGASPNLIPSLSQIAIFLNDQAVGTIPLDSAHQNFGPTNFDLDPLSFTEVNRLNFRFSGRYAVDCNDPLSGLLWATISDLSTVTLTIAKISQQRDLARLPEPFFDRRQLHSPLELPFLLPENAGATSFRAAAIAASWFSAMADYRGADFPVSHAVPASGNAVVLAVGNQNLPDVTLPAFEGPTLALVPNPHDQFGTLLVIGGRTDQEAVVAALALARVHGGLSGDIALVQAEQPPSPQPYVGPNLLSPDGPVRFGTLVEQGALEARGYAPGPIRIPLRTAPDLYTWRNNGVPVDLRFRAPPGPIVDLATSRLDVLVSGTYLRSIPLAREHSWLTERLLRWLGLQQETQHGRVDIPTFLLLGRQELELNFDMRPLSHGQCSGVPGDIRSNIDPNSTIDISHASHYVRMPNLGFFASSGFPFTRLADLSSTAAVLPQNPTTAEATAFLDVIGMLAAMTGTPSTGLEVVSPDQLETAAERDLLVIGALDHQPAFATLLRDNALKLNGRWLTLSLPGPFQQIRTILLDAPSPDELNSASLALNGSGEGAGMLLGLESALASGRSVVAVTGMTPSAVGAAAAALRNHDQSALIRGDLALIQATGVQAFRTTSGYDVGHLPIWLQAQRLFGDNPIRTGLLLIVSALLVAFPLFWMLRRWAVIRLRARTPEPQ